MNEASRAVIPYVNSRLWSVKLKGDAMCACTSSRKPRSGHGSGKQSCCVDRAIVAMKEHTVFNCL